MASPAPWPLPGNHRTQAQATKPALAVELPLSSNAGSSSAVSQFALPLTPQSSVASLTCATPLSALPSHSRARSSGKQGESTNVVCISPDVLAVGDLLSTMKRTIDVLGTTFDCLGEQAAKVAELTPAIEATNQVSVLQKELSEHFFLQEARVGEVTVQLESVVKETTEDIYSRLDAMILEVVETKVKERVKLQLTQQIPDSLRQQVNEHKRQILEVQTNLHNSEARRYNATLHATSLSVPLRPLLRPLPTPLQSPCRPASSTVPPTPKIPEMPAPSSTSTTQSGTNGWATDSTCFEPPTPSPLFPRDLASLLELGPHEARALVKDYGLLADIPEEPNDNPGKGKGNAHRGRAGRATGAGANVDSDGAGEDVHSGEKHSEHLSLDRERNISRFMAHIGVPFRVASVPVQSKQKARTQLSRLIINVSYNSTFDLNCGVGRKYVDLLLLLASSLV